MAGIGLDQLIAQPQSPAQLDRPRLVGDERVWTPLDRESVETIRRDHPAQSILGFQDRQIDRPAQRPRSLGNPVRGRQAGQASADHDHAI